MRPEGRASTLSREAADYPLPTLQRSAWIGRTPDRLTHGAAWTSATAADLVVPVGRVVTSHSNDPVRFDRCWPEFEQVGVHDAFWWDAHCRPSVRRAPRSHRPRGVDRSRRIRLFRKVIYPMSCLPAERNADHMPSRFCVPLLLRWTKAAPRSRERSPRRSPPHRPQDRACRRCPRARCRRGRGQRHRRGTR